MSKTTSIAPSDWRKILIVWGVIATAAAAGVLALWLYSVQIIDRINKSNRNHAAVGGSFQREGERHFKRALDRVQELKDAGQPGLLPASDPDVAKALELLGIAHDYQPYNAMLLSTMSDLHALTGNRAAQMHELARFYIARDNKNRSPQAALELFQQAAAMEPENAAHERGVAQSLLELKRFDEAETRTLALVARAGSPDPDALFLMGQIKFNTSEPAAAVEWLNRAVAAKPDHAPAVKLLGQILDWTGQPDKAVETLERALPLIPHDQQLLHLLAQSHMKLGQTERALERLLEAYKLNPRSLLLIEDIILAQDKLGNAAAVRFYTNKALDLDPKFVAKKLETRRLP